MSEEHYTIFKNQPNIIENTTFIPLINHTKISNDPQKKQDTDHSVSIFLGQPIYETDTIKNIKLIKKILSYIKPDYYMPHPREEYKIEDIEYIDTPLIFEQYMIEQLKNNPTTTYHIYSICSTAILNIKDLPKVYLTAIRILDIDEELKEFVQIYDILDKYNIDIIEI